MNKYLIACIGIAAFWVSLWIFIGSQTSGVPLNVEGLLQASGMYFGFFYGIVAVIYFIMRIKSRNVKSEVYTPSKPQQPPKQQQDAENKTQFWVCPVCGSDTKEYHGRSYCHTCERYL